MTRWPDAPYKGLNYYSTADAPLFCRRDDEIEEVVALLAGFDTRVVLLQGGTGSGKSSFLRAGLVPRLQAMQPDEGRRYFFLRERGADSDPLLIRTSGDPVARIYEALQSAAALESVPAGARAEISRVLSPPIPQDRTKAIPAIMAALKALTAPPQRDVFLLLVDQAEEVLTLTSGPGVVNARDAFFALLEQICFHLADLRMIVALRTEWLGRFNSFLRIRPTNRLTSAAEPRAGLFDYLLEPMRERDIAAAIRHPTLVTKPRDDDPTQAESVYRFSYDDGVPELIAADLEAQSGEVSALPTMQIVCKQLYDNVKDHLPATITEQDYIRIGRAEGAIDAFVDRALHESAAIAGLPPLGGPDLDRWTLVLSLVVGRSEGGTVQTLVASEDELVEEAGNQGIAPEAARAMLPELAHPDRQLLRAIGRDGGATSYSLGHDSLGSSVLRRSAQAAARADERAAAERRLGRTRRRQLWAVVAMLLMVVVVIVIQRAQMQDRISTINTYVTYESSNDYRRRLLLLVSTLQNSRAWPDWFVGIESTKDSLRKVLKRSPVFGGTFAAAAWDSKGRHVVRLEEGKLIVHDLDLGRDAAPAILPELPGGHGIPPSLGLLARPDGDLDVIAFQAELDAGPKLLGGGVSSKLTEIPITIPLKDVDGDIERADIFEGHVRIRYWRHDRTNIAELRVLRLTGSASTGFASPDDGPKKIEWNPIADQALRQPFLAEDCDDYAFVSKGDDYGNGYHVWHGVLDRPGGDRRDPISDEDSVLAENAVTIARGCGAMIALIRDDKTISLKIIPLIRDDTTTSPNIIPKQPEGTVPLGNLGDVININIINPVSTQEPSMIAAAPLPDQRGWRVGWPTAGGLAIVDVAPGRDCSNTQPKPAPGGSEQSTFGGCLFGQLLTGADTSYVSGSLSFSRDGSYAFMFQQGTHNGLLKLRVFNLDFAARERALEKLTTSELIREACRVAKLVNESNTLTPDEKIRFLGDANSPQPCAGVL